MTTFSVLVAFWDIGHGVHEDGVRLLVEHGVAVTVNPRTRAYTEEELVEAIEGVDGVLASARDPLTRKVFNAADRLKVVARTGVGYDNVDVRAATTKGVCVTLTPIPEHIKSVADATFTLILSALRRIPQLDSIARSSDWKSEKFVRFVHDAYGKRLGIIGLGKIGAEVARRAKGFEMDVTYYDIDRKYALEKSLGVTYLTLEELLSTSDIVSIHAPLTAQTRHMIGKRELAMVKAGTFLINTARGGLVDETALYQALRDGKLAGAGLDVMEQEPPSLDNPLLKLENVVLTPHAAPSYEDMRTMAMVACDDMLRVFHGMKPKYLLNQEVLQKIHLKDE